MDEPSRFHGPGHRACRVLNVAVAVVLLILIAPLMLAVWALVRLTSRGPAIYRQLRIGIDQRRCDRSPPAAECRRDVDHGGRIFTIYKFRTMYVDHGAGETWAREDDPRVTPVGRLLRASRLDELPQLFNVLRGDMNIVGPRPEQPGIFARLRSRLSRYRERQRVLPGITGLAQVRLGYPRSLADVKRKVALDLLYIRRRSPAADLLIMARTPLVMLLGRRAVRRRSRRRPEVSAAVAGADEGRPR